MVSWILPRALQKPMAALLSVCGPCGFAQQGDCTFVLVQVGLLVHPRWTRLASQVSTKWRRSSGSQGKACPTCAPLLGKWPLQGAAYIHSWVASVAEQIERDGSNPHVSLFMVSTPRSATEIVDVACRKKCREGAPGTQCQWRVESQRITM